MTLMKGSFIVYPIQSEIPYSVNATVDADVSDSDKKGWKHLSDIFPVKEREFVIDGTITVTQASGGNVDWQPKTLTPTNCAGVVALFTVGPLNLTTEGVPFLACIGSNC